MMTRRKFLGQGALVWVCGLLGIPTARASVLPASTTGSGSSNGGSGSQSGQQGHRSRRRGSRSHRTITSMVGGTGTTTGSPAGGSELPTSTATTNPVESGPTANGGVVGGPETSAGSPAGGSGLPASTATTNPLGSVPGSSGGVSAVGSGLPEVTPGSNLGGSLTAVLGTNPSAPDIPLGLGSSSEPNPAASLAPIPEPCSLAVLGLGALGLLATEWHRHRLE